MKKGKYFSSPKYDHVHIAKFVCDLPLQICIN